MALSTSLEVERVVNLIRGFGWTKIKEEISGDKLILTIEKKIEVRPVGTPS